MLTGWSIQSVANPGPPISFCLCASPCAARTGPLRCIVDAKKNPEIQRKDDFRPCAAPCALCPCAACTACARTQRKDLNSQRKDARARTSPCARLRTRAQREQNLIACKTDHAAQESCASPFAAFLRCCNWSVALTMRAVYERNCFNTISYVVLASFSFCFLFLIGPCF